MGTDRNKARVFRKERPFFLSCYSFHLFSDIFIIELSADRAEISPPTVLLFLDKYNVQPCPPILLTSKWLKRFSSLFPFDVKNR